LPASPPANILTVDLEEWFHLDEAVVPPGSWETLPSRVERNVDDLLDLLDAHGARATIFALGWVADRHPRLIRAAAGRGHEIATHGYLHRSVAAMTEAEFVADLRRAREAVETAGGERVAGHRAARWSLGGAPGGGPRGRASGMVTGALDALIREGFRYDASLAPIIHIGDPRWPLDPYRIDRPGGSILEFPPLVGRCCGVRLLLAGGWALRRVPNRVLLREIAARNARGAPAVLDLHSWELDPDPPRLPLPPRFRLAHYGGRRGFRAKLDDLLARLRLVSIRDHLAGEAPGASSADRIAPVHQAIGDPKREARSARSRPSTWPSASMSAAAV
jgi:polysaccharide deacetylase family protein (PEP-CTERM system associated)